MVTKVKYLAGWLNPDNFDNPGYWECKAAHAIEARQQGSEIVCFRIPLDKTGSMADPDTVKEIEEFLQQKFGR